jgi:hypothetical protein
MREESEGERIDDDSMMRKEEGRVATASTPFLRFLALPSSLLALPSSLPLRATNTAIETREGPL